MTAEIAIMSKCRVRNLLEPLLPQEMLSTIVHPGGVMTSGNNRSFMQFKSRYVLNHILITPTHSRLPLNPTTIDASAQLYTPSKNIHDFDIRDTGHSGYRLRGGLSKLRNQKRASGSSKFDPALAGGTLMPIAQLQPFDDRNRKDRSHELKKPSRNSHRIRAYYLPWDNDRTWQMQLGSDASFFFTPTLSGCTVAVGSGQEPIVCHSNYRGRTGQIDQQRIDQVIGTVLADDGTPSSSLKRDDYDLSPKLKGAGISAQVTLLGFKSPRGDWTFAYQRRLVIPAAYCVQGCATYNNTVIVVDGSISDLAPDRDHSV